MDVSVFYRPSKQSVGRFEVSFEDSEVSPVHLDEPGASGAQGTRRLHSEFFWLLEQMRGR